MGDMIVSELHGRYYEAAYRRSIFNAANQTGIATTVGLATTYTGLLLSNPINSPVNLVLNKVGFSFLVAFTAAATLGLMTGYNSGVNVTHTAAATPRSSFFGLGAAGYGLADTSATMPTAPVVTYAFGSGLTGAISTEQQVSPTIIDLEGSLILPPGAYTGIYTSTASGALSMIASFSWEEVPI
jgi:hypothetical protein